MEKISVFHKQSSWIFFVLLPIVFSFLLTIKTMAQNNEAEDKFSLRLMASPVNGEPFKYNGSIVRVNYRPQVGLSGTYQVFNNFDVGLYLAYSNIGHFLNYEVTMENDRIVRTSSDNVPSHALFYGVHFNYHLLSLLFKTSKLRFDVYPIIYLGYTSRKWGEMDGSIVKIDPFLEYHAGMGLGYMVKPRFGFFGEYTRGRLYNEGRSKFSLGLTYQF